MLLTTPATEYIQKWMRERPRYKKSRLRLSEMIERAQPHMVERDGVAEWVIWLDEEWVKAKIHLVDPEWGKT